MANATAVRIHRFGGPEALQLDQVPIPEPGDGEVLVRVHAAGVNPVDYKIRQGGYPMVRDDQLARVLGRDMAGTVECCGPGVGSLKQGDPVFAFLPPELGGYAEYVCLKAADVVPKPDRMDFVQAGAVPLAAMTAMQGLLDHGRLEKGQRVLIHGGAGGVGHFAVQIAKERGATVITTVSAQDIDFVRSLGADEAVDYKSQRFEDVVQPVDIVYDLIAGETQARSWAVLKRGGTLISTLQKPDPQQAERHAARAAHYMAQVNPPQLSVLAGLIDAGKLRVHVDRTFPLDHVQQAHHALEHDHIRGKIVLTMTQAS